MPLMTEIDNVYIADNARVIGRVRMGAGSSIWFATTVRADVADITIGKRVNIQDASVLHCDHGQPQVIEDDVSIGHGAVVHGLRVGAGSLIGMGARVMGGVKIGKGCLVAAGAVVPPGTEVPDGHLVVGVPGKVARPLRTQEKEYLAWLPEHYRKLATSYVAEPDNPARQLWQGNPD